MILLGIFIITLLIFANGFFVAAEFALVSVRPSRLEELIKDNRPLAVVTKRATTKLNDMLSTCQVGITVASLLLGWIGEMYLADGIANGIRLVGYEADDYTIHGIAITVSFILITFFHILLGELLPKALAIQKTESLALMLSIPMFFFYYLFFPVTVILNGMTQALMSLMGIENQGHNLIHSAEELMILLEEQNRQGKIDKEEFQIIQNTFQFSEHLAKDVMNHRLSIVGVAHDTAIPDILPIIAEHHFSRYPVYEETTDKIIGIVHVQAFLTWQANPKRTKKSKVTSIMQPPIFVPETMSIEKVMQKLRENSQHMAIVIDEYGGVSGLLTLEDIMEEIFGQIRDETDDNELEPVADRKTNALTLDGESEIDELQEILSGVDTEDLKDVRTIAGFILERLEEIPQEGATVPIPSGLLKVEKMEGNKITSVRYLPAESPAQEIAR